MPFRLLVIMILVVGAMLAIYNSPLITQRDRQLAGYRASLPKIDTIIVNPAMVTRTIPSSFFGINYTAFWDDAQGSRASARALALTPIKVVRFPGGAPADWYDWQAPYYQHNSTTSPMRLCHYARSFGTVRVIFQTNYQGHLPNPPGKSYAVNSAENAATWVTYNIAHGIRADMEVGNEEDMSLLKSKDDPDYTAYIAGFNAQTKTMHQADPWAHVLGPPGTNEWFWWSLGGLNMFPRGAGNRTGSGQANGISLHFYQGSSWNDSMGQAQYWLSPRDVHRSDGWGLFYGTNDTRPVDTPTPTYYMMVLWRQMGNRMITSQQSDDPATATSSYATTRKDGSVQVLVINKRPSARKIRIELQRTSPVGHHLHVYRVSGVKGNVTDLDTRYTGADMPSFKGRLPSPKDLGIVRGRTAAFSVPGYSAAVLVLDGTSHAPRLRWQSLPPPIPAAPLSVELAGTPARRIVKAGETQQLTALVRSNDDLGSTVVDLEVYDPTGKQVFQGTQTVNLTADKPITVTKSYRLPVGAYSGQYRFKVGAFGPDWQPLYGWHDAVDGFLVVGMPFPQLATSERVAPNGAHAGTPATLMASVSAARGGVAHAVVDFEIYSNAGVRVWQGTRTGIDIPRDGSTNVSLRWPIPLGQASGDYVLKIGVFGEPTWHPMHTWNDSAAVFTIRH